MDMKIKSAKLIFFSEKIAFRNEIIFLSLSTINKQFFSINILKPWKCLWYFTKRKRENLLYFCLIVLIGVESSSWFGQHELRFYCWSNLSLCWAAEHSFAKEKHLLTFTLNRKERKKLWMKAYICLLLVAIHCREKSKQNGQNNLLICVSVCIRWSFHNSTLSILILLISILVRLTNEISCFVCSSEVSSTCGDPFDSSQGSLLQLSGYIYCQVS